MIHRRLAGLLLLSLAPTACTVVNVRGGPGAELHSNGLVEGFASAGWADDPALLRVDVLDGRSPGAIARLDLWYLARFELGMAGVSAGVGPLDFGIGTLFYDPTSPTRSGNDEADCTPLEPDAGVTADECNPR